MSSTEFIQRPLSSLKKLISARKNEQTNRSVRVLPAKKLVTNSLVQNDIPHCKTVIDLRVLKGEKLKRKIQKLILSLFPISHHSLMHEFKLERASGALTNAIYFVTIGSKRLLLRIYGIGCEQILDRDNELDWLSRLSRLNIGPKLLATFENGRFEEYLESTTLTPHDLRDPDTSVLIASRLHQLHSIVDTFPPSHNEPLEVWRHIEKWLDSLPDKVLPALIQKNQNWADEIHKSLDPVQLRKNIEICKTSLNALATPIVFAHNDTQYGNILRVDQTNELVVIDFEYAGYNPRGYDIANHFCEWMYDYHSNEPAKMSIENYPTREEQIRFLSAYSKDSTLELLKEVEVWKMACHLFWALWGLVQASQSEIEFDYFGYSMQRLESFKLELNNFIAST